MIQDESLCENSMDGASKDIQGSSELISQLVETSQTAGNSEKVPTVPRLPFGLSVSPKEFHILEDIHYNITCQQKDTIKHRK